MVRRLLSYWAADIPLTSAVLRWQAVAGIDALGTGMMVPITVLYFVTAVHLSLAHVGAGLAVSGLAGAAALPFAGILIDRFRPKAVIMACLSIAGLAYLGFLAVSSWLAFVAVMSVAQIAAYSSMPANKSFAATIVPAENRVRVLAFQRSMRNVGYALGGLTAGLLLALPDRASAYHGIIIVDALSYFVAAALTLSIRPLSPSTSSAAAQVRGYLQVLSDRRYLALATLNIFVLTHVTALTVVMPLWIHYHTSAPLSLAGILFTVNTLLVVLLQVRFSKDIARPSEAAWSYIRAAVSFTAAAIAYLVSGWLGGPVVLVIIALLIAIVAHTGAELWAAVGEWATSMQLAPDSLRGRYLALFSLSYPLHQAIVPGIVLLLMARSAALAWPAMALLITLGCIATTLLVRGAADPNARHAEPVPKSSGGGE